MKLLLDENLSRRIVPALQEYFPETTQVILQGFEHADDLMIWQFAKAKDYVIVTKDEDFLELSSVHGYPPKIILLSLGNCTNQDILASLINSKDNIYQMLSESEIGIIEIY